MTKWLRRKVGRWKTSWHSAITFNDISMLEAAGTGVAMGNADDAVKARANIVIGDNPTDSIAQFIYSHLI
ncbi:HAD hydrolase family protein [Escherichia coli]